ncbi:MAG: shikimate dehydrogenase [Opitutales bacterium]
MNSRSPITETSAPESTVFTLDDLDRWSFDGVSLAVLGFPVKHSISPSMHNAALRKMAETDPRFAQWRYFKFAVPPEDLARALPLFYEKRFRGINLTIPHKILAVDQVAEVDPAAAATGAINTLLWRPEGYRGFNTDGYGLAKGIETAFRVKLKGSELVLLGAGGAARAAAVLAVQEGCRRLFLGNRTLGKLEPLQKDLHRLGGATEIRIFDLASPPTEWQSAPIVVNATSAGLKSDDPAPVDLAAFPAGTLVYDMIYNPAAPSLVRAARVRGLQAANGLSMLVYQGVRALEIWSDATVPEDVMRQAAEAAAG